MKNLSNEGIIKRTRLTQEFFLLRSLKNQCIAQLRTYFLNFLEGKRTSQDVRFIVPSLLSQKKMLSALYLLIALFLNNYFYPEAWD